MVLFYTTGAEHHLPTLTILRSTTARVAGGGARLSSSFHRTAPSAIPATGRTIYRTAPSPPTYLHYLRTLYSARGHRLSLPGGPELWAYPESAGRELGTPHDCGGRTQQLISLLTLYYYACAI
jgi:hypothetical protein